MNKNFDPNANCEICGTNIKDFNSWNECICGYKRIDIGTIIIAFIISIPAILMTYAVIYVPQIFRSYDTLDGILSLYLLAIFLWMFPSAFLWFSSHLSFAGGTN